MITVALFFILLLTGFPIFGAILAAGIIFMISSDLAILIDAIPLQLYGALEINSLLAIPLFLLVGEVMNKGGLTQRLIAVAELLVGRLRGGMAYANLLTNAMAASILGSAIAQIGVMSRIMVPAMEKRGYDKSFSAAVTVSGGLLGPIFPPSMLMIIYGVVAVQPIAPLFIAGILPGIAIFLALCFVVFIYTLKSDKVPTTKPSSEHRQAVIKTLLDGILPALIPVVVVVGISAGVMTPTEAGAVASLIAFLLCFIYREIKIRDLYEIFLSVCVLTATISILISVATFLSWVLAFEGIPDRLVAAITAITESPFVFMLLVIGLMIFLGLFLESISVLIVLVPILMPVVTQLGIDPIQFGVICAVATTIGVITPPVGPGLFVVMGQTNVKMASLVRSVFPFLLAVCAVLVLTAAVPELSTWLPAKVVK
ncbi:tripartite ATP-independent transporter DctM subunit [Paenalcaligenes hominis]|uniref:TRAP transporter large permease protein n=1 Tax=Paenalcaligenes hominis TaxID=643674 RepID=A0ABX0WRA9_9BURK|nr:TRAP transporter large permease [Paenalcaligenes hominis]NJB65301.1 tripartite ATP-independent transporter DctM subunit [Paenalcaligenes hominis]GGE72549.1 C4-dicarboxylate ABC transporter permease [Paenalcaligenes hominis]